MKGSRLSKSSWIAAALVVCMVTSSFVILSDTASRSSADNELVYSESSPATTAVRLGIFGVPDTSEVGSPLSFLLIALDRSGNASGSYRGTVDFSSTDSRAIIPDPYTFVRSDGGQRWFPNGSLVFNTSGIQSLNAFDIRHPEIRGNITVTVVETPVPNTPPVADFVVSPTIGNADTYFIFDASLSTDKEDPVSALRFRWDWDGNGVWDTAWSSIRIRSHAYHVGGLFAPALQVMDTGGLTGFANHTVCVDANPPFCDAGPDVLSYGVSSVALSGQGSFDSETGIVDYAWSWSDWNGVHVVHGMNPVVSVYYTSQEMVPVTLTVTDGGGNQAQDVCLVTAWPSPMQILKYPGKDSKVMTAWGMIAPDHGEWTISFENHGLKAVEVEVIEIYGYNMTVNFLFQGIVKFQSFNAYPTGTVYLGPLQMQSGLLYQVTVKPSGNAGTYAYGGNSFVSSNQAPIVKMSVVTGNGTNVHASASTSVDPDGDLMRFVWDWGDGSRSYGTTAAHTYAAYGQYTISLKAIDEAGAIGMTSEVVTVAPSPVASIHVVSIVGLTVTVDGSGSYSPGGTIRWYSWQWKYGGMPTIPSSDPIATHTYEIAGTYLISLQVFVDNGASGQSSVQVTVTSQPPVQPNKFTMIYDMFQEPWGDWWDWRYPAYMNSIILSDVPGKYTMIFNPDMAGYQAIIYAPYRMNVSAFDMTNLNAHHPEFMPVLGSENVSGCQADVTLYFNYLDQAWWDSYWAPTWSGNANWPTADIMTMQRIDGFYLGVVYGVTLNRAAAEAWLGMPQGTDASTWWAANSASYRSAWIAWLLNEGNSRLDIYSGYEWPLTDLCTMMDLVTNPDGTITLSIGHISWGYEVLMTRWLTEAGVCNHEPWYEDFYLTAHYKDAVTQWVSFDACCQMSLHAVNATGSSAGSAWAWEPNAIDYIASTFQHPSDFDPYVGLTYTSQNAGDPMFGQEVPYEYTPTRFNVEMNSTLMFILPTGSDVIGYAGMRMPSDAILQIVRNGDYSAYEAITRYGAMTLGDYVVNQSRTGGPDLRSMYDPVANVLTIRGPVYFDNVRHPNGALYHGAPWIEFNVGPVGNLQPVAVISSVSVSGLKVTVDGSGSYDLDGTFLWYKWTWDDGSPTTEPSTSPTATHTYVVAGTYTIRLEVVDAGGRPDNAYRTVTVGSPPPMNAWTPMTNPSGHYIELYAISTLYGPGIHIDTTGSSDYPYVFMGVNNGTYVIGQNGTMVVSGYFRQFDTLYSYDQPGRRFVAIYVLSSNSSTILATQYALNYTDPVDTWLFREVLFSGLAPGSVVKVGIGRDDHWLIDWSLTAEWAGTTISTSVRPPPPSIYWSSPVSIDTGMNLQTYSGPAVDSNSKGEAIAAWSEDNGTQWGVWANRFVPGSGWQGAEFVSSASPYTYTPCVGMDENGNATVAWISGGSILSRRYVSNSGWQGLTIVSNSQNNPSGLTMAVEGSGRAVMGWEAWDGSQWSIFASYRPIGDYWLAPTLIEGRAGQADTPKAAISDNGDAIVVYAIYEASQGDIWANIYMSTLGRWTGEALVENLAGYSSTPQISMDAQGNAVVVWTYQPSVGLNTTIWANEFINTVGWMFPANLESPVAGNAFNPDVAAYDGGKAIAVWDLTVATVSGTVTDVRSSFYSNASGWSIPSTIESQSQSALGAKVCADSVGNVYVAWSQSSGNATGYDIVANYFNATTGWTGDVVIKSGVWNTSGPDVATGEDGSAVIVWDEFGVANNVWASDFRMRA